MYLICDPPSVSECAERVIAIRPVLTSGGHPKLNSMLGQPTLDEHFQKPTMILVRHEVTGIQDAPRRSRRPRHVHVWDLIWMVKGAHPAGRDLDGAAN
jgi:hypothetical protein